MKEEVFEAPAVVIRDSGVLKLCTPYGNITIFENGWEFEKGLNDDCEGEVVLVKVRESRRYAVVKYADGKIYAVKLDQWPEVVIANLELELPEWARF